MRGITMRQMLPLYIGWIFLILMHYIGPAEVVMIHLESHDAVELHDRCEGCNAILRRAFNDVMPELELGPNSASMLIERIQEIAEDLHAAGAAS